MRIEFTHRGTAHAASVERDRDGWRITFADGRETYITAERTGENGVLIRERLPSGAERVKRFTFAEISGGCEIAAASGVYLLSSEKPANTASRQETGASGKLTAPMPGMVVAVFVQVGQMVERYQPVAAVEAMKVMATIEAPFRGTVSRLEVEVNAHVAFGAPIAEILPLEGGGE